MNKAAAGVILLCEQLTARAGVGVGGENPAVSSAAKSNKPLETLVSRAIAAMDKAGEDELSVSLLMAAFVASLLSGGKVFLSLGKFLLVTFFLTFSF